MTLEIRKIHVGAGHAPIHKMRLLLREAGQWTDTVKELVKGVIKDCPVKKCREAGEIQKKDPYAAIRLVREPGDLVSVDLKIRSGSGEQDILYAVDCATSFCVAGPDMATSKNSHHHTNIDEIQKHLFQTSLTYTGPSDHNFITD